MLLSTIGFVLSMWEGQKMSRKASEIIEKSTETSAKQCISKEKFEQSLKVHTKCAKSVNKLRYVKILHLGGSPPHDSAINKQIVLCSYFLYTFCLLFNLFWTFPLKSIGFLRFQLIFRWFFNDFSGFSAYFQDILTPPSTAQQKIQKSAPDEPP